MVYDAKTTTADITLSWAKLSFPMGFPIGRPTSIEVRMAQPSGVLPSISAISRSSGPATAWIVRVVTLG